MKASDIPYIVIGLALLGLILYRQLQRRPIRSASNNRLPLILGVIGLVEVGLFILGFYKFYLITEFIGDDT